MSSDNHSLSVAETIKAHVVELRQARGLTLQEVADRAGTTKSYIWEIERGTLRNPTIGMAVALARAFGVSLNSITGLSADQPDLHPEALRIACEIDALLRSSEQREAELRGEK